MTLFAQTKACDPLTLLGQDPPFGKDGFTQTASNDKMLNLTGFGIVKTVQRISTFIHIDTVNWSMPVLIKMVH